VAPYHVLALRICLLRKIKLSLRFLTVVLGWLSFDVQLFFVGHLEIALTAASCNKHCTVAGAAANSGFHVTDFNFRLEKS